MGPALGYINCGPSVGVSPSMLSPRGGPFVFLKIRVESDGVKKRNDSQRRFKLYIISCLKRIFSKLSSCLKRIKISYCLNAQFILPL